MMYLKAVDKTKDKSKKIKVKRQKYKNISCSGSLN